MPRVQVANKLHEGRARARRAVIVCIPDARLDDRQATGCNEQGLAHARPTMLCIHLVIKYAVAIGPARSRLGLGLGLGSG